MTTDPGNQRSDESRPPAAKHDNAPDPAGARQSHASPPHPSPPRILVVDDDETVRESLGEVLASEQYQVHLADDGRNAVRNFLDRPPDLILLDVNMPDITGWQTFAILAQLYPAVPVMIITARPDQANRAADLGVNAFMEKPLDIPELLRIVRALLADPNSRHFLHGLRIRATNDLLGTQG